MASANVTPLASTVVPLRAHVRLSLVGPTPVFSARVRVAKASHRCSEAPASPLRCVTPLGATVGRRNESSIGRRLGHALGASGEQIAGRLFTCVSVTATKHDLIRVFPLNTAHAGDLRQTAERMVKNHVQCRDARARKVDARRQQHKL
ncbi:hypothetical protein ERJ75_001692200 [Trypanosoma vivax]|nr:hypothetical protein ERJ75_001692200 [Trypanosoma vivax]